MLKARVIPTMLWKDVGLVKGVRFDSWRRTGSVMPAIKVYNTRDVDELILLDIMATREGREPDFKSLEDFAAECFVPLTVGGGIRTLGHIRELLRSGADKVCINTAAYEDPDFIRQASSRFGAQCIVGSIDARRGKDGRYECFHHAGTRASGKEARTWAAELERLGAGEILITSIDRDGTMEGYDIELTRQVAGSVSVPVIASGGAGNYGHMLEVFQAAHVSAVAAASIFHFTEQTPLAAKSFLASRGVLVRNAHVSGSSMREVGR